MPLRLLVFLLDAGAPGMPAASMLPENGLGLISAAGRASGSVLQLKGSARV